MVEQKLDASELNEVLTGFVTNNVSYYIGTHYEARLTREEARLVLKKSGFFVMDLCGAQQKTGKFDDLKAKMVDQT